MTEATELVEASRPPHTRDDDEELSTYLIDKLTDIAAAATAAVDEVLEESKKDERTLV
jgi:hypothetical protein